MENIPPGSPSNKKKAASSPSRSELPLRETSPEKPSQSDSEGQLESEDEDLSASEDELDEDPIPPNHSYSPDMVTLSSSHPLMKAWDAFHHDFCTIIREARPSSIVMACPAALPLYDGMANEMEDRSIFIV